ncbi:MAG: hypothetical protein IID15_04770 [Candidatus Marinimicrobia bacterium]|nr:hypothetical protein [Candidatus Neomarinimicrobiota bacterium]
MERLTELFVTRGVPSHIRFNNGSKIAAENLQSLAVDDRCYDLIGIDPFLIATQSLREELGQTVPRPVEPVSGSAEVCVLSDLISSKTQEITQRM